MGKGKDETDYYTHKDGGNGDTVSRQGTVIAFDPSTRDTTPLATPISRGCFGGSGANRSRRAKEGRLIRAGAVGTEERCYVRLLVS